MTYRYNPYIVGSPVEGQDFYGRESLLNQIWNRQARITHLLGMRRIGKTSLLKALAATRGTAIYLDLQSVGDWAEFAERLQDEIEANHAHFPWLPLDELLHKSTDLFRLLRLLDNYFHRAGGHLWLLLDEAEVLIDLGYEDLRALRKFQSFLRHIKALQIVFASAKRLIELDALASGPGYGSPFLNEFPPPIYIGGLSSTAARDLIQQSNNPPSLSLPNEIIDRICRSTNNHPYLIQWVCYHLWERNPDTTTWNIDNNTFIAPPTLLQIIKKDFDYLAEPERQVIRAVLANQAPPNSFQIYTKGLAALGYLSRNDTGFEIGNAFFRNWLLTLSDEAWTQSTHISAKATLDLYKKSTKD